MRALGSEPRLALEYIAGFRRISLQPSALTASSGFSPQARRSVLRRTSFPRERSTIRFGGVPALGPVARPGGGVEVGADVYAVPLPAEAGELDARLRRATTLYWVLADEIRRKVISHSKVKARRPMNRWDVTFAA